MKFPLSILFLSLILLSCKSQNLTPEAFATDACNCLKTQSTGDIDSRLEPCMSKPINDKFNEIHKIYYTDLHAETAIKKYMMDVTVAMINTCDKFYIEMDNMYNSSFPEIKIETVEQDLLNIEDSLSNKKVADTIKIKLLNRRARILTKARKFNEALNDINFLDKQYEKKAENYYLKVYILKSMGDYKTAIAEINNITKKGENDEFRFVKAMVERKLNGR